MNTDKPEEKIKVKPEEQIVKEEVKDSASPITTKEQAVPEEKSKKGSSFLTSSVPTKEAPQETIAEQDIKKIQEEFFEENFEDEILFKEKCKLYAFNKTKKKMEERGVGNILVSRDKKNDMVKIVMIRESVMRFGCNHYINPKFKLEKHSKIVNALVWATTEDTVDPDAPKDSSQIFLVKFDDEEISNKFKEEVDKGRLHNKNILENK